MSVQERLATILTDLLGLDAGRVTLSSRFRDDLGADSLQIVEVILSVEDAFGILLTDATADLATVGELVHLVEAHRA